MQILIGILAALALVVVGSSGSDTESQQAITDTPTAPSFQATEKRIEPKALPIKSLDIQKPSSNEGRCHPSYSGCLNPNASDYDCAGGSGNGPYYTGTVQVYGPDVFDLDRDNDGIGCE